MPPSNADRAVLDAARVVLRRDPRPTMASIAAEAGMGVAGLYRRYTDKQTLLLAVAADNLRRYIAIGEAALSDTDDSWAALSAFLTHIVDEGIPQLAPRLAALVRPDDTLRSLTRQADLLTERLARMARGSGILRTDLTRADLTLLVELLGTLEVGDGARSAQLRRRYLALLLDALRVDVATHRLPGPAPSDEELARRFET